MDRKAIFKLCKELGCCDGCGLRYLGIRIPSAYENIKSYALKFKQTEPDAAGDATTPSVDTDSPTSDKANCPDDVTTDNPPSSGTSNNQTSDSKTNENVESTKEFTTNGTDSHTNGEANGRGSPQPKRRRTDNTNICVSCLGLLQEDGWPDCNGMVKEMLDKKRYDCTSFACGLSTPMATILREKAVALRLAAAVPAYDAKTITPLKEAWKWSYCVQLASFLALALDSGAVSPLLVTLNMEYPDDLQELEVLKTLSPALFASRSRQRKRFAVEFTRRSVEQALEDASLDAVRALPGWGGALPGATARAACVSVVCARAPLYLGGRYIKLSRTLPQSPWLVAGVRMMESSVQEIIFEPLAKIYEMSEAEADHRLKFMSAGREDVDVRCLGDGRPFAIEVTDPRRELTPEELKEVCNKISAGGQVVVKEMQYITREDLTVLKTGEETKCKTYEALCIKLTHSEDEAGEATASTPIIVTDSDIARINAYRNTPPSSHAQVELSQRTPIRVLHRRPLLVRTRYVLEMEAFKIPEHPQLFVLRIRTSAGAYVKEFVHGELGRTAPALAAAGAGRADILALDVTQVHLDWPNK